MYRYSPTFPLDIIPTIDYIRYRDVGEVDEMKTKKKRIITHIKGKFVPVGIKTIDSKNRITIGERIVKLISAQTGADEFQIFYGEDGDILLRPMVSIPSKEAWIYQNPDVLKSIRQGLTEAKREKTEKVENLEEFLEDL